MGNTEEGKQSTENILLNNILNTTQDCIFWKDINRRFVGVNQAFLDYYGFQSVSEIVGKTDEDVGWHRNPQPFMEDELRVLQGESTYMVHGKCIAHGVERDILASKRPLYDGDQIIGLVGSFIDVTDALQKEKEITELNKKLEFSLKREREINHLMAGLMSRIQLKMKHSIHMIGELSKQLVKDQSDQSEVQERLSSISDINQSLDRLSAELLDLRSIQNDGKRLEERLRLLLKESEG